MVMRLIVLGRWLVVIKKLKMNKSQRSTSFISQSDSLLSRADNVLATEALRYLKYWRFENSLYTKTKHLSLEATVQTTFRSKNLSITRKIVYSEQNLPRFFCSYELHIFIDFCHPGAIRVTTIGPCCIWKEGTLNRCPASTGSVVSSLCRHLSNNHNDKRIIRKIGFVCKI